MEKPSLTELSLARFSKLNPPSPADRISAYVRNIRKEQAGQGPTSGDPQPATVRADPYGHFRLEHRVKRPPEPATDRISPPDGDRKRSLPTNRESGVPAPVPSHAERQTGRPQPCPASPLLQPRRLPESDRPDPSHGRKHAKADRKAPPLTATTNFAKGRSVSARLDEGGHARFDRGAASASGKQAERDIRMSKAKTKRDSGSDSDGDRQSQDERLERLAQRRSRRREKALVVHDPFASRSKGAGKGVDSKAKRARSRDGDEHSAVSSPHPTKKKKKARSSVFSTLDKIAQAPRASCIADSGRLTIKDNPRLGLFAKGKASIPSKGRHSKRLPDLVFSELGFLNRRPSSSSGKSDHSSVPDTTSDSHHKQPRSTRRPPPEREKASRSPGRRRPATASSVSGHSKDSLAMRRGKKRASSTVLDRSRSKFRARPRSLGGASTPRRSRSPSPSSPGQSPTMPPLSPIKADLGRSHPVHIESNLGSESVYSRSHDALVEDLGCGPALPFGNFPATGYTAPDDVSSMLDNSACVDAMICDDNGFGSKEVEPGLFEHDYLHPAAGAGRNFEDANLESDRHTIPLPHMGREHHFPSGQMPADTIVSALDSPEECGSVSWGHPDGYLSEEMRFVFDFPRVGAEAAMEGEAYTDEPLGDVADIDPCSGTMEGAEMAVHEHAANFFLAAPQRCPEKSDDYTEMMRRHWYKVRR